MIISLDYDGTYTQDSTMWDEVVEMMQEYGHEVIMVTARPPEDPVELLDPTLLDVYYTSGRKKHSYMLDEYGIDVDVWIDDRPQHIDVTDDWHWCDVRREWKELPEGVNIEEEDSGLDDLLVMLYITCCVYFVFLIILALFPC